MATVRPAEGGGLEVTVTIGLDAIALKAIAASRGGHADAVTVAVWAEEALTDKLNDELDGQDLDLETLEGITFYVRHEKESE